MTKIAVIAYEGLHSQIEPRSIQIIDWIPLDVQQCHAWVYFRVLNLNSQLEKASKNIFFEIFHGHGHRATLVHARVNVWRHIVVAVWNWIKFAYAHRFVHLNLFLKKVNKLLNSVASTLAAVHRKGIEVEALKVHYIPFPGFFSRIHDLWHALFYWRHEWPPIGPVVIKTEFISRTCRGVC